MRETIEKMQEGLRAKRESGELAQPEYNMMVKAKNNPLSKTKAIYAFCFHCHGGTLTEMPDSGWRESIKNCTATDCPLYLHRPGRE